MPVEMIRQADETDLDELHGLLQAAFSSQAEILGLSAEDARWHTAFRDAEETLREMGYLQYCSLSVKCGILPASIIIPPEVDLRCRGRRPRCRRECVSPTTSAWA